jgi:uncharacterized protein (UPF0332 family)
MEKLNWCFRQREGIRFIEPNDNLAESYLKLAENALGTMNREKKFNLMFAISACYYSMYYSLYSVLMKIGIKCEIHSCTLEIMKVILKDLYSASDVETIKKAFDARIVAQYYVDKVVKKEDSDFVMQKAPLFLAKSKEILSKLNEDNVNKLRDSLRKYSD